MMDTGEYPKYHLITKLLVILFISKLAQKNIFVFWSCMHVALETLAKEGSDQMKGLSPHIPNKMDVPLQ